MVSDGVQAQRRVQSVEQQHGPRSVKGLPDAASTSVASTGTRIFDIRRQTKGLSLIDDIAGGLSNTSGNGKELPTLLLYDEAGLKLFEEITYLNEYYLTNEEIGLLQQHANAIAEAIPSGAILCELGSG